jgi:hypothetical protein
VSRPGALALILLQPVRRAWPWLQFDGSLAYESVNGVLL